MGKARCCLYLKLQVDKTEVLKTEVNFRRNEGSKIISAWMGVMSCMAMRRLYEGLVVSTVLFGNGMWAQQWKTDEEERFRYEMLERHDRSDAE